MFDAETQVFDEKQALQQRDRSALIEQYLLETFGRSGSYNKANATVVTVKLSFLSKINNRLFVMVIICYTI